MWCLRERSQGEKPCWGNYSSETGIWLCGSENWCPWCSKTDQGFQGWLMWAVLGWNGDRHCNCSFRIHKPWLEYSATLEWRYSYEWFFFFFTISLFFFYLKTFKLGSILDILYWLLHNLFWNKCVSFHWWYAIPADREHEWFNYGEVALVVLEKGRSEINHLRDSEIISGILER